ncbi:putative ORfan [Saudi moumouvirus]|nr:putative ORfan [Saudi moumouvirus]
MESQKHTSCLRIFFNKIIKFIDKFNNYIIIASDDGNTVLVDLLYNDNVNKSCSKNNFL